MANKLEKGCTFGLVLQNRVNNMEDLMKNGFDRIDKSLDDIKEENKQMFNHMSNRPTNEAARTDKIMWAIMGGMGSVLLFLIGLMVYGTKIA